MILPLENGATLLRATPAPFEFGGGPPPPTVNPNLALPARHEPPPLDNIPIPPGLQPISLSEYVSLDSVRAALAKFDIQVPVNDIMSAIREEESKLVVADRRHTICKLALHQSANPQFIPKAIPNPPRPKYTDLDRRRHLCRLAKEAAIFPNGKVPDPLTWSYLGNGTTPGAEDLPFIHVESITIANAEDPTDDPPRTVFANVWCLWDTGAQTSYIVTNLLGLDVTNNQENGSAVMELRFHGATLTIESPILFRPSLPNGATFIILGGRGLIKHTHYQSRSILKLGNHFQPLMV